MQVVHVVFCAWVTCVFVPGGRQVHGKQLLLRDMDELRQYLDDLKYIEDKEEQELLALNRDNGKPDEAEQEAWEEACDVIVSQVVPRGDNLVQEMSELLHDLGRCLGRWESSVAYANWDYETNMTEENSKKLSVAMVDMSSWTKKLTQAAKGYYQSAIYTDLTPDQQRQIRLLSQSGDPVDENNVKNLVDLGNELQDIYSKTTVGGQRLEPELTEIMATSRDNTQLLDAWLGWHDNTGPKMKDKYEEMVHLMNIGASDNGYDNYATYWMQDQFDQTDDMESMAEALWQELVPLYQELHAYVRSRLARHYPQYRDIFNQGTIPAHLLGNMWAQDWGNIYDLVKPYPEVKEANLTAEMLKQNFTVDRMFNMSEQFYTSIGLSRMTEKFKKYSIKTRPSDGRDIVCHASAFDFYKKDDFRIKMCSEINTEHLETVHHEMGHIEYFMQYADLPSVYRTGANSAFHEAIGDTMSLSVMSKKHLEAVGLDADRREGRLANMGSKHKETINFLLKRALFKISFLPFGYMIDKWRWDVFKGTTGKSEYNRHWWDLRLTYQGLVSPVPRSEEYFDPGAKYHIPSNAPYICYFISFISQFQFYEAMCNASGHVGELHECDFYQSLEAGSKLKGMLKLGKSKPWPEAMEELTGSRDISTGSIRKYFQPLYAWLKNENQKGNQQIGWSEAHINWSNERSLDNFKALYRSIFYN